jgi:hypothetical protein
MSLRAFHLFFIAVAIGLSLWVGAWGVQEYLGGAGGARLGMAVLFFVLGGVLAVYGLRVRRKLRDLPR